LHINEEVEIVVREWLRMQEPDFYRRGVFGGERGLKIVTLHWNRPSAFNVVMRSYVICVPYVTSPVVFIIDTYIPVVHGKCS
jgi:hypothetical protein